MWQNYTERRQKQSVLPRYRTKIFVLYRQEGFDDAELDKEKGAVVYEIEFYADGFEYDYEIDAVSGNVLGSEKEFDD